MSDRPGSAVDYKPISHYGVIGDMHTAALVALDGSIDWYCAPRFDSPSVFAALLDVRKGGKFQLFPTENFTAKQSYEGETNVLSIISSPSREGSSSQTSCPVSWRMANSKASKRFTELSTARKVILVFESFSSLD